MPPPFGSVDQRCMPVVHIQSVGCTRGLSGAPGTRAIPDGALKCQNPIRRFVCIIAVDCKAPKERVQNTEAHQFRSR